MWTTCEPCKGGNQYRKIVREKTCNETGHCGKDCEEKQLTSRPCPGTETCEIKNAKSKWCSTNVFNGIK